ncbi:ATP synthase F1 subunit epsilon [Candidatus Poribacteria bacterium]|nr:ATP synthase F1 subunit epsilon [Candidatus Poribacteria bacterium]
MYDRPFSLRIITPARIVFEGNVVGVLAPGSLSPFEVLGGHVPLVSSLEVGEVRITRAGDERSYLAIGGGVLEARRSGVTILADSAEFAREIDIPRAERARARALERVRSHAADIDHVRAEAALARATNRLSVARGHGD